MYDWLYIQFYLFFRRKRWWSTRQGWEISTLRYPKMRLRMRIWPDHLIGTVYCSILCAIWLQIFEHICLVWLQIGVGSPPPPHCGVIILVDIFRKKISFPFLIDDFSLFYWIWNNCLGIKKVLKARKLNFYLTFFQISYINPPTPPPLRVETTYSSNMPVTHKWEISERIYTNLLFDLTRSKHN